MNKGVVLTLDAGKNWKMLNDTLDDTIWTVAPGAEYKPVKRVLYWWEKTNPSPPSGQTNEVIYCSRDGGETIYNGSGNGYNFCNSYDYSGYGDWIRVIACCATSPNVCYVSQEKPVGSSGTTPHIYKTIDFGETWTDLGPVGAVGEEWLAVYCMYVNPNNPDMICIGGTNNYTLSGGHIGFSTDGGLTWTWNWSSSGATPYGCIVFPTGEMFWAAQNVIFNTSGTAVYTESGFNPHRGSVAIVDGVTAIFPSVQISYGNMSAVLTTDRGTTFTKYPTGIQCNSDNNYMACAGVAIDGKTLYFMGDGNTVYGANNLGVYSSADNGATWALLMSLSSNTREPGWADPASEKWFWVLTHTGSNARTFFLTKNGGLTWKAKRSITDIGYNTDFAIGVEPDTTVVP